MATWLTRGLEFTGAAAVIDAIVMAVISHKESEPDLLPYLAVETGLAAIAFALFIAKLRRQQPQSITIIHDYGTFNTTTTNAPRSPEEAHTRTYAAAILV